MPRRAPAFEIRDEPDGDDADFDATVPFAPEPAPVAVDEYPPPPGREAPDRDEDDWLEVADRTDRVPRRPPMSTRTGDSRLGRRLPDRPAPALLAGLLVRDRRVFGAVAVAGTLLIVALLAVGRPPDRVQTPAAPTATPAQPAPRPAPPAAHRHRRRPKAPAAARVPRATATPALTPAARRPTAQAHATRPTTRKQTAKRSRPGRASRHHRPHRTVPVPAASAPATAVAPAPVYSAPGGYAAPAVPAPDAASAYDREFGLDG